MSTLFQVDPSRPGEAAEAIAAAAEAVGAGGLAVFPTDTVYGIACRPDDPDATGRLFEAKRRPSGLNLPVLAPSVRGALELVVPNEAAQRLARAFWPGPLTMVLPRGEQSGGWSLGAASETIGVRVPDHPLSLALLRRAGPLAATSANISGGPGLTDAAALREAFGAAVAVYIVVEASMEGPSGQSSTVVDLTGKDLRVVRQGPIEAARVSSVAHSVD